MRLPHIRRHGRICCLEEGRFSIFPRSHEFTVLALPCDSKAVTDKPASPPRYSHTSAFGNTVDRLTLVFILFWHVAARHVSTIVQAAKFG